jgi:hypothetical protein
MTSSNRSHSRVWLRRSLTRWHYATLPESIRVACFQLPIREEMNLKTFFLGKGFRTNSAFIAILAAAYRRYCGFLLTRQIDGSFLATGGGNTTTLTATGSPSGGTYSWSAVSGQGNISISNTGSQSVTITAVAVGTYTVQVKYTVNNQPGTATTVGKVQQPGSLGVVSNDVQGLVCTNASPSYSTRFWTLPAPPCRFKL